MAANMKSTQRAYSQMRHSLRRSGKMHRAAERTMTLVFCELDRRQRGAVSLGNRARQRSDTIRQMLRIIDEQADEADAVQLISLMVVKRYGPNQDLLRGRARYLAELTSEAHWNERRHDMSLPTISQVLDYGCGDADVSLLLSRGNLWEHGPPAENFQLFDVVDARSDRAKASGMPFTTDRNLVVSRRAQLGSTGYRYSFGLLITVLHHCDDPDEVLDFVLEQVNTVFLIESVLEDGESWTLQMLADWFYNRCLHPEDSIPVPGNYRSWKGWVAAMEQRGFELDGNRRDYGIDIPIVPERHVGGVFFRRRS